MTASFALRRLGGVGMTAAALAACGCRPRTAEPASAPGAFPSAASAPVAVTLERTACYGTCPAYTVRLDGAGRVAWHGERFVAAMGDSSTAVSAARVNALADEIAAAGFFGFGDSYLPGVPAAEPCSTDSPHAVITVTRAGRTKRVEHDYGCRGAPAALRTIAARIDSVAGTRRWIGRR
ncbi:MAG: hypothetical protein JWM27_5012 [Gemmatimonadetes bacterium]|nr:hypothetical protein [Gemmatimonadota bacterium]